MNSPALLTIIAVVEAGWSTAPTGAEAAETAEGLSDEHAPVPASSKVTRGHSRTRTLQVRLNGDEYEAIEMLAKGRDLPVSTVARGFLLDAIRPKDDLESALDRLEHDVADVRRWLSQE